MTFQINKFYKLTINHDSINYVAEPIQMYHVFIRENYLSHIVIMYNFSIIENEEIKMSCDIPYYMSDGWTNHFRANMLYPFYCFNKQTSLNTPKTNEFHDNVLIKNTLVENMNISILNEDILDKTFYMLINKLRMSPKKTAQSIRTIIDNSLEQTIDLYSVLPRIMNLLNFLIAINVKFIINNEFGDNIIDFKIFRPNYQHSLEKYTEIDINEQYTYPNGESSTNQDDVFRIYLYSFFKLRAKMFIKANLYTLDEIILEPIISDIDSFNCMLNFCENNNITENTRNNYDNYILFSNNIFDILSIKINKCLEENTLLSEEELIMLSEFKALFSERQYSWTVEEDLQGFKNASCKMSGAGKYLYFKNKYLYLKNKN